MVSRRLVTQSHENEVVGISGEVTERPKVRHWKCRVGVKPHQGFESLPLRWPPSRSARYLPLLPQAVTVERRVSSALVSFLRVLSLSEYCAPAASPATCATI